MPVKILVQFLQNRFIIIIPVWHYGKYWRKVMHLKLLTISIFPWSIYWKWQSTQFLWNDRPCVMVLILVCSRFAIWHPKCLIQWSVEQSGKIIRCREFLMHLNLANLKILFCKNHKWPPGCLRHSCIMMSLRKSNQIGLLHRQMDTLSSRNENLSFLLP